MTTIPAQLQPPHTMKTERSIKQLVGRAISLYNQQRRDCSHSVIWSPDGSFTVNTTVAMGDNVPWAKKPLTYVWNSLNRFGIKQVFAKDTHSQGHCSATFVQTK